MLSSSARRSQLGTATPPCPDHAGSAPNTLTGAEVVLFCWMFRRRISRIELTIHASGGRRRGSHRAAVVAYVLLIFGSSKTPVARTSPYVPRLSDCSRKYCWKLRTREIWIQISWESMENRHLPGVISETGHATPSQVSLGPCVICMRLGEVWGRAPLGGLGPDRGRCAPLRGAVTSLSLMSDRCMLG